MRYSLHDPRLDEAIDLYRLAEAEWRGPWLVICDSCGRIAQDEDAVVLTSGAVLCRGCACQIWEAEDCGA